MKQSSFSISPFPGLRPFEREDSAFFFGRRTQILELAERLESQHILSVIGGSGCGKSSIIRAGLLPHLAAYGISDAGPHWQSVVFTPGDGIDRKNLVSPLFNFARAFLASVQGADASPKAIKRVVDMFSGSDAFATLYEEFANRSVRRSVETSATQNDPDSEYRSKDTGEAVRDTNYIILIDQFEELFKNTAIKESHDTKALINAICDQSRTPHKRVYLLLTMRSEHLADCAAHLGFPDVINSSAYLVRRLTSSELRDTIVKPLDVYCERVARNEGMDGIYVPELPPELIKHLVQSAEIIAYDPDHLPLFQHCLFWLWQEAKRDLPEQCSGIPARITLADLDSAVGRQGTDQGKGGENILHRCLDFRCQKIYDELVDATMGPDGQKIKADTDRIFSLIGTRDQLNNYKRNPVPVARLDQAGIDERSYKIVHENFTVPHAYLRITSGELDIYHESLIRNWIHFRRMVDLAFSKGQAYREVREEYRQKAVLSARQIARFDGLELEKVSLLELERYCEMERKDGSGFDTGALLREREEICKYVSTNRRKQVQAKFWKWVKPALVAAGMVVLALLAYSEVQSYWLERQNAAWQAFAVAQDAADPRFIRGDTTSDFQKPIAALLIQSRWTASRVDESATFEPLRGVLGIHWLLHRRLVGSASALEKADLANAVSERAQTKFAQTLMGTPIVLKSDATPTTKSCTTTNPPTATRALSGLPPFIRDNAVVSSDLSLFVDLIGSAKAGRIALSLYAIDRGSQYTYIGQMEVAASGQATLCSLEASTGNTPTEVAKAGAGGAYIPINEYSVVLQTSKEGKNTRYVIQFAWLPPWVESRTAGREGDGWSNSVDTDVCKSVPDMMSAAQSGNNGSGSNIETGGEIKVLGFGSKQDGIYCYSYQASTYPGPDNKQMTVQSMSFSPDYSSLWKSKNHFLATWDGKLYVDDIKKVKLNLKSGSPYYGWLEVASSDKFYRAPVTLEAQRQLSCTLLGMQALRETVRSIADHGLSKSGSNWLMNTTCASQVPEDFAINPDHWSPTFHLVVPPDLAPNFRKISMTPASAPAGDKQ